MSVIQLSPCILIEDWTGFIDWCARTFDMPVSVKYDDQGWGRLTGTSEGLIVISNEHFRESAAGEHLVIDIEVNGVERHVERARANGAEVIVETMPMGDDMQHASIRTPQGVLLWLSQESEGATEESPTPNSGPIHFTVDQTIDASVEEVFGAVTRGEHLERAFVKEVSANLDGSEDVVEWSWGEDSANLHVMEFRPNDFVAFHWKAHALNYHTRTQFVVSDAGDGKTRLAITESGWNSDPKDLQSAFTHCEGWTSFAKNIRLLIERDIESV